MPVFQVPEEYYGLVGLGRAGSQIGNTIRGYTDRKRNREREDFVFDEEKKESIRREEDRIIKDTGQGSEAHVAFLKENNLPFEGILVPQEVRNTRRRDALASKPPESRTAVENAELNALEGKPLRGYEAELADLQRRTDLDEITLAVNKLTLNEARLTAEDRIRAREILQTKYNISPGELDALTSMTAHRQAEANLNLTNANIAETNSRANYYDAQAAGEAEAAATGGYDKTQIRQMTQEFNTNRVTFGGRPFTTTIMQQGLARTLPPEEQKKFDTAYTHYNLIPKAKEANEAIAAARKRIATITAQRAVEARREKPNEETLAGFDNEIAGLRSEIIQHGRDYQTLRETSYGVPVGSTTPRTSGTGPSAPAEEAPEGIDPAELRKVALEFGSIAAIDAAEGLDATQKSLLKNAFIAATATASTPRPAAPARPATPPRTPPKAVASTPATERRARTEALRTANNNLQQAKSEIDKLREDISNLRKNISSAHLDSPLTTQRDRDSAAAWTTDIATKEARIKRLEATLPRLTDAFEALRTNR